MSGADKGRDLSRRGLFRLLRGGAQPAAPSPARPAPVSLVADINWEHCTAYRGEPCDRCVVACGDTRAIRVDPHGHPRIDQYACTGCGACEPVCPTYPQALTMIPR